MRHGFNFAVELDSDDEPSRAVFERITERDALKRVVAFKDDLGLARDLMLVTVESGDGSAFGDWESTAIDRVHRVRIFAGAHEGHPDGRVFYTLAHEMCHAFLHAHGFGWLQAAHGSGWLQAMYPDDAAARYALAHTERLAARAEESLAVHLAELLWRRLLP